MADINVKAPKSNDPSFLSYSQGTDRAQPNRAFDSLFSGATNTFGTVVEAKDQETKMSIENTLYQGVDPIRNSQGVDTAVEGVMPPTSTLPTGAQDTTASVAKLTQAYNQGKISDTYYWSRIEAMTRQVRNRYPGYREEVDQKVAQITGSNPANALRRSILEDIAKAEAKAQVGSNRQETFYNQNLEWMSPATVQSVNNGTADFNAVRAEVAQRQAMAKNIEVEKSKLNLADAQGQANSKQGYSAADQELSMLVDGKIGDIGDVLKGMGVDLLQLSTEGKIPNPEDVNKMRAGIQQVRYLLGQEIDKILTTPLQPGSTSTYSSVINDPGKVKAIREQYLKKVDDLQEMLTNGEYGSANLAMNMAKNIKDTDTAKVYRENDTARKLAVVRSIGGENAVNLLNTTQPGFLNQTLQGLTSIKLTNIATGTEDISTAMDDMKKKGVDDPNAYKVVIDQVEKLLKDRTQDPRITVAVAKSVFSQPNLDFLNKFEPAQRMDIFTRFTSPEVTKNLTEVRNQQPQVWSNYKNWALNSFGGLYKQELSDVKDAIERRPYTKVSYDPQSNQFSMSITDAGKKELQKNGLGVNSVENWLTGYAATAVKNVNNGLRTIDPILRADGQDPSKVIPATLGALGIDPNAQKENTLWSKFSRAVVSATEAAGSNLAADGKQTSKDTSRPSTAAGEKVNVLDAFVNGWNRAATPATPSMDEMWGDLTVQPPSASVLTRTR